MSHYWICLLATLIGSAGVVAQTGDREQPIEIVADSFNGDEVNQKAVYTGNVEIRQGTLHVTGDRAELSADAKGYRTLVITGRPVRMKERRDPKTPGMEEWIHANALKAVYSEKTDRIVLQNNAKIARSENGIIMDSTEGAVITYDLLHATSRVEGSRIGNKKTRISAVLSPRKKEQPVDKSPSHSNVPLLREETQLRNK